MTPTIPLLRPLLPSLDRVAPYLKRIDTNRYYTNFGPLQQEFLSRLINLQQEKEGCSIYGVLTANATLGLELVIDGLDLPIGSRIAVPALTFVATAAAVERCGHIPVVVDVDDKSWLLTPKQMPTGQLLRNICAVIPVSTFGMPQDVASWELWSSTNNIPVIFDAAAAFGAQAIGPNITAVFSFHATKALSSGEGGLILTRSQAFAERLLAMTNFGIGLKNPTLSGNAKMSEYHAAVGLAHLDMWGNQVIARMCLYKKYRDSLEVASGKTIEFQADTGIFAPSLFCMRLLSRAMRDDLELVLARENIQTRRWYLPLLQHQVQLKSIEVLQPTPNALRLSETLLGLPFFVDITDAEFEKVCRVILDFAKIR